MTVRPASCLARLLLATTIIQLALALAAGRIDIRTTCPTRRLALLPRPPPVGVAHGLVPCGRDDDGSPLRRIGGRPSRAPGWSMGSPRADRGSQTRSGRLGSRLLASRSRAPSGR